MTREQAIKAALEIQRVHFPEIGEQRNEKGNTPAHLAWMIEQMVKGMSENKTMRWLGYIQGMMVGCFGASLEEMKEVSRAASETP
jgi:hypothetical protein